MGQGSNNGANAQPHAPAHTKKRAMLAAMADCGNVTVAAERAEIGRRTHYDWLDADSEYAQQFSDATEEAMDKLEAEATRRAMGVERDVFNGKGEKTGTALTYSDTLLMFLLNGRRSEVFRPRVEHIGEVNIKHDVVLQVEFDDRTALPKVVQNLLERSE